MKNEIEKWFKKDMVSQIVDKEIKKRIKRYPIVLAKTKKEVMQFKNVKDICVYVDLDPKHTLKIKNKFKPVLILAGETNCVSEYSGLNCILYGQSWIRGVVNHCEFHESSMGCVVYGKQITMIEESNIHIVFVKNLHMQDNSICYVCNMEPNTSYAKYANKEKAKNFKGIVTLVEQENKNLEEK